MLELIPILLVGGALLPNLMRKSELQKIEEVFVNTGFCVKSDGEELYPTFIEKKDTETARRYTFRLPLGLTIKDDLDDKLSKSLNRNIEVDGDSEMHVWIYKLSLPTKWNYGDVPENEGWVVPVGKSSKGMIWHDFDKIPHMTIAGMTRYGKTVMTKAITTYLIEKHPKNVEFYIIDMKGGLEFNRYSNIKQVQGVASNVSEAKELLNQVYANIESDMLYFKSKFYTNVVDAPVFNRKFVLVDEGAELTTVNGDDKDVKKDKAKCQKVLSNIARVSGALGYRLIYCTQYPTEDTLPRQIKQNADGKVSFRLPTGYASKVAIDETGAKELEFPGRAIYRTSHREIVQVPFISDSEMWARLRGYERDKNDEKTGTLDPNIIEFG